MSRRDIREALQSVKPTLLDRAIGYFAPVAAANRMRSRMLMAISGGGYTGASRTRRQTKEWKKTQGNSADGDLLPDLEELRDRSRDLVRNSPLAGGAIETVVTNVVGSGLSLQAQVDRETLGMSEEQAAEWNRNAEREFNAWAGSANCDLARTQDFYEMQDLALRSTLESGDIFFLTPYAPLPGMIYGLRLQAIEADRCRNKAGVQDTPTLAAGVEVDEFGAPSRYHFAKPSKSTLNYNSSTDFDTVDAFGKETNRRNVLHLFDRLRPGQRRGVPWLAGVIEPLKQISTYSDAEIMAAVVSSMFTVFTHTENREGLDAAAPGGMGLETGAQQSDADIKLAAGAIVDLGPNEKVDFANPQRPNTAFDPFVQAVLRQVGVRLGLPFEVLIKHYTASYSAARAAILDAWRFFYRRRAWLATKFCQPVYELFLEEAVSLGRIAAPGFFDDPVLRAAYCSASWYGDGPGSIDPVKEYEAAKGRIEIGISTLAKESVLHDGGNWEDKHAQRKKEKAARVADGLEVATGAAPAANPKPAPAKPEPDPDAKETN